MAESKLVGLLFEAWKDIDRVLAGLDRAEAVLGLRHALLRICAHHYFHIGEIATKRSRLGQQVGDYPGPLEDCV